MTKTIEITKTAATIPNPDSGTGEGTKKPRLVRKKISRSKKFFASLGTGNWVTINP